MPRRLTNPPKPKKRARQAYAKVTVDDIDSDIDADGPLASEQELTDEAAEESEEPAKTVVGSSSSSSSSSDDDSSSDGSGARSDTVKKAGPGGSSSGAAPAPADIVVGEHGAIEQYWKGFLFTKKQASEAHVGWQVTCYKYGSKCRRTRNFVHAGNPEVVIRRLKCWLLEGVLNPEIMDNAAHVHGTPDKPEDKQALAIKC